MSGGAWDPFAVLGVERRFWVDRGVLEAAYLRASRAAHPDRVGNDAEEAVRRMAVINDAKETLIDDERRARALVKLAEDAGVMDGGDRDALPAGFLEETLEVRMLIDEAIAGGDSAAMAEVLDDALERERGVVEEVGPMLDGLFGGGVVDGARLRELMNAWRYVRRMLERLEEAQA